MHYIDIVILIPLLWGLYKGFSKGLVVAVSTFLALFLGVYGAINFSSFVSDLLIENFDFSNEYLPIISFAITFVGIVILVHLLAKVIDTLVKSIALGFVNKILGAIFGIARTLIIISIVILLIHKFDKNSKLITEQIKTESLLYSPINDMISAVYPSLENLNIDSFSEKVNGVTDDLNSKLDSIPVSSIIE